MSVLPLLADNSVDGLPLMKCGGLVTGQSCRSQDTESIVDAVFLLGNCRPEHDIYQMQAKVR